MGKVEISAWVKKDCRDASRPSGRDASFNVYMRTDDLRSTEVHTFLGVVAIMVFLYVTTCVFANRVYSRENVHAFG